MLKQRHATPRPSALAGLCLSLALMGLGLASCAGGPKPGQPAPAAKPEPPKVLSPEEQRMAAISDADKLLQSGDAAGAAASLGALAAAQPSSVELRLLKAAALASAEKIPEARTETDAILQIEPANPKALVMASNLARFAGDEAARKTYLERGLAAAPGDASVLAAWGQLLLDQENWKAAEDYFRRSIKADAANPDAPLGLGQSLYRQSRYPEADDALTAAIALDPGSPFAYSDRSKTRYQQGKYVEALADIGAAIERSPDSSWFYLDRGRMYMSADRKDEALADFGAAIKIEPNYFLPYVYRAGLFEEKGRDEEAAADYRAILKLEPDYWYAHESLGAVAFRLGLWAESAASFRATFGKSPDRYEYAILAGLAYMRAGKPQDAKNWAGSVAPTVDREKNGIYWLMLRLIQDQNDQTSELEVKLQGLKSLDDKTAMLFYLSEYWIFRGKTELAVKYLILAKELGRVDCLEYRLLLPEMKRLGVADSRGH